MPFSAHDRDVLRTLAGRVAELAARPIEDEKRRLWRAKNGLQPVRPIVMCDPENGWNEIILPSHLECTEELARGWEYGLRREIFWGEEMGDDRVVSGKFNVGWVATETDWGLSESRHGGEHGGSNIWDAPVASYDLLDKLHAPTVTVDRTATEERRELAESILGDLLKVRVRSSWFWTLGLTQTAVFLRGLEQFMLDMLDEPEGLHRFMSILRDGTMSRLDQLESQGLFSLNNDDSYVGSGGYGWVDELPAPGFDGHVRTQDMWALGESQETVGVSPDMFEEFIFPYQEPLLRRFGLVYYGCCEPVDKRWHIVKRLTNLRGVSVSPWSDMSVMAENLGTDYVYYWKPSPNLVSAPDFSEEFVRKTMREGFEKSRGCHVAAILKDTHTICNEPSRVKAWARIAREEAERVFA